MNDYEDMFSPDALRSIATGMENGSSSAEHLSRLFYEAYKADKERRGNEQAS